MHAHSHTLCTYLPSLLTRRTHPSVSLLIGARLHARRKRGRYRRRLRRPARRRSAAAACDVSRAGAGGAGRTALAAGGHRAEQARACFSARRVCQIGVSSSGRLTADRHLSLPPLARRTSAAQPGRKGGAQEGRGGRDARCGSPAREWHGKNGARGPSHSPPGILLSPHCTRVFNKVIRACCNATEHLRCSRLVCLCNLAI